MQSMLPGELQLTILDAAKYTEFDCCHLIIVLNKTYFERKKKGSQHSISVQLIAFV